jgi:hypothetical protein
MLSQLSLDWPQFAAAVVLLLVPLPLFFGKGVEFRELDRSWQGVWMKAVLLPWHWIDLVRVGTGTWLLMAAIGLTNKAEVMPGKTLLALAAGVLAAGMVAQAVACRAEGVFFVPFVYVLATTAVLFPPLLAAPALILAITASFAFRSLAAFLWWLPACLVALGNWLYPNWLLLGIGAAVSILAALLPLLFQREFVFAHRGLPPDAESMHALR